MAGRLRKIVDYVTSELPFKNLALATFQLMVEEDISRLTPETPDDPVLEAKYLAVAKKMLKRDTVNVPFQS